MEHNSARLTLETRNLRTELVQQTLDILLLHRREPTRVSGSRATAVENGLRVVIKACPQDILNGVSRTLVEG